MWMTVLTGSPGEGRWLLSQCPQWGTRGLHTISAHSQLEAKDVWPQVIRTVPAGDTYSRGSLSPSSSMPSHLSSLPPSVSAHIQAGGSKLTLQAHLCPEQAPDPELPLPAKV